MSTFSMENGPIRGQHLTPWQEVHDLQITSYSGTLLH